VVGRQSFSACFCWMCMNPLLLLLFSFSIHKSNPGFITCYLCIAIEKLFAIFVNHSKKTTKADAVFCAPVSIFGTNLAQNLW
jgi:hypothetical protein